MEKKHWVRSLLATAFAALVGMSTGPSIAETVVSVTQTSYDNRLRPTCTAVRMSPGSFGNLPASACDLGTEGSHGPDRITRTDYDVASQVTQVHQAVGTSVQRAYSTFSYNLTGQVTDSIDANGNRTKMAYDDFGRLSGVYYPSAIRPSSWNSTTYANALATAGAHSMTDYEAYQYDANGNRTYWRRRDGQVINDCFDNLNRVVIHFVHSQSGCPSNAGSQDVYTAYDLTGKVLAKRFGSLSGIGVSYAYDGLSRLTTTTDISGRTLSYQYNSAGARTRLTYPSGQYIAYTLDALNRQNKAVLYTSSSSRVMYSIAYNHDGTRRKLSRVNNILATESPDSCTTHIVVSCYGYDKLGRVTSIYHDFNTVNAGSIPDITWGFSYNPAGQITSISSSHDQFQNAETTNATNAQTHDGLNRIATLVGQTSQCPNGGYDLRGNLICDGAGRSFTYDAENRLLTAAGNGMNLTLVYDTEGRLAHYTTNGVMRAFAYDGVNAVGQYDGSGQLVEETYFGPGVDEPLINYNGTQTRLYWTDYQGSVVGVTFDGGTLLASGLHKYTPYGEPKDYNNNENWTGSRFRYTGQMALPEARLYYYKARVYDPGLGRFLQTDPIGSEDDLNLYAYTGGDPINGTDPSGTCVWDLCIGEGAAVTYAAGAAVAAHVACVATDCYTKIGQGLYDGGKAVADGLGKLFSKNEAKPSDRPPAPDGKTGSTGGPGAGKRFKPESPEVKESKEGVPCRYCGTSTTNQPGKDNSRERDHIDPKSKGGNDSPENEGDSCRKCNREKGARNPDEWKPRDPNKKVSWRSYMPEDEKKRVMVSFELDAPLKGEIENLHAVKIGEDLYEIDNSPFYVYGISYRDRVIAQKQNGSIVYKKISEKSGHSTYRVRTPAQQKHEYFLSHWTELKNLGCTYEGSGIAECRLYSIDIPPSVDVSQVYRILQDKENAGVWSFEEADYSA